jgi:hypothetical protein
MCIPHGTGGTISSGNVKERKKRKPVERVSQETFEHGDPDFVDERISEEKPLKKEKSLFSKIFAE